MTWDNWGKFNGELNHGWDIDHIIPISSAKNESDTVTLCNYKNLRPLCSKVNRHIKRDNQS
jgi:5-methylcytosine-specific restriction endonuclease McrA